ncbi:hypothetical protein J6590_031346 [Homalodisca vitripennis]|nr:hypothetical protein J6590_031346 [Homalodisca vitripennis]
MRIITCPRQIKWQRNAVKPTTWSGSGSPYFVYLGKEAEEIRCAASGINSRLPNLVPRSFRPNIPSLPFNIPGFLCLVGNNNICTIIPAASFLDRVTRAMIFLSRDD